MPVQGANVLYTVYRRAALWCWYDTENEDLVYEGKAVTDEKGDFEITLPFIFPDEKNSKKTRSAAIGSQQGFTARCRCRCYRPCRRDPLCKYIATIRYKACNANKRYARQSVER